MALFSNYKFSRNFKSRSENCFSWSSLIWLFIWKGSIFCWYDCYPVYNIALILLGKVSFGKEDQRTSTDYSLPKTLKNSSNSNHALSRLEPSGGEIIDGDVFISNWNAKINKKKNYCSNHDEYIVYNTDQIRLSSIIK